VFQNASFPRKRSLSRTGERVDEAGGRMRKELDRRLRIEARSARCAPTAFPSFLVSTPRETPLCC
jgi:hypothetical protein